MYRCDEFDHEFVQARVAQFTDQVERRPRRRDHRGPVPASPADEQRLPAAARLHAAYRRALRHAEFQAAPDARAHRPQIRQGLRALHHAPEHPVQLAGAVGHSAILADLASVEMHAIQTVGQLHPQRDRRPFRRRRRRRGRRSPPYAEILRQWSSVHPEFSYLPRKFKIAVTGAERDRAAIQTHDIGLHLKKNAKGELGFAVYVGGGQGRTPMVAKKIRDFLPEEHLLSYSTAILRVYNLYGRRDNKYKARIKILRARDRRGGIRPPGRGRMGGAEGQRAEAAGRRHLAPSTPISRRRRLPPRPEGDEAVRLARLDSKSFSEWLDQNVVTHSHPDYAAVTISLKGIGEVPGDASRQPDGSGCRPRGEIRVRRDPRQPRAEPRSCRMSRAPT